MSGGTQISTVITHGCKNFEEKKEKVTSRENQEIRGGALEDLVDNARRTTTAGKASIMFRGIYDEKQGQGICGAEGIGCRGWTTEGKKNVPYTSENTA